MENFEKKYKEIKIEGKRRRLTEPLYTEQKKEKEMCYIGNESKARKQYQENIKRGNSYECGECQNRQRSS